MSRLFCRIITLTVHFAGERPAGVPLAGVDPTGLVAGAGHGVDDVAVGVGVELAALPVVDDRNEGRLQALGHALRTG